MKKIVLLLACLSFSLTCASARIPKNMNLKHREFLSEVRYLITAQEARIFKSLPLSERDAFIDAFWEKRDPDPATEANEFKDEYYKRIQEANHLFSEGGKHGWLEDRGRIYILLGPPWEREVYPRGKTLLDPPTEIWYYGQFPIAFVDSDWNGSFELDPLSARQLAIINKTQMDLKPVINKERILFDFDLSFVKTGNNEGLVRLQVPYKNLWLIEDAGRLKTSLDLALKLRDSSGTVIWEDQKNCSIDVTEEELKKIFGTSYLIEVPLKLSGPTGRYALLVELKNKADELHVQKTLDIEI